MVSGFIILTSVPGTGVPATKFAHAELACMVMGARVPCVLTSRGDSAKTKLYSIALAALQCK